MASKESNARYWTGVLYPENMVFNWEIELGDLVQLPYAYCIHDKDIDDEEDGRKVHVHIILAFPNTTTYKNALSVFSKLNAPGKVSVNRVERVINIRQIFEYLIHNTETCKKKGKHLYDQSERHIGNCFDIGAYEQVSVAEKHAKLKELCDLIVQNCYTNFIDFYMEVASNFDSTYFEIVTGYSGILERLTKGNYQKMQVQMVMNKSDL